MSSKSTDPGADAHRIDPFDKCLCMCGKRWDEPPTMKEWEEHVWGPPEDK